MAEESEQAKTIITTYPEPKEIGKYGYGKAPKYGYCPYFEKKDKEEKESDKEVQGTLYSCPLGNQRQELESQFKTELKEKEDIIKNQKDKILELEAQMLALKEDFGKFKESTSVFLQRLIKEKGGSTEDTDASKLFEVLESLDKKEITERILSLAPSAEKESLEEMDLESLKRFETILSKSISTIDAKKKKEAEKPKKSVPAEETLSSRRKTEYSTGAVIEYLRSIKK